MWELVGAVVGAGLASGREITAFFAKYGGWGYAGIILSGVTIGWLGQISRPMQWRYRWQADTWKWVLYAMLIVTAGAMLSGAGELARMIFPVTSAYWLSILVTLTAAWLLANKSSAGLSRLSLCMMIILTGMLVGLLFLPVQPAFALMDVQPVAALLSGIKYGGFNAALQSPLLEQKVHSTKTVWSASLVCSMLLALGVTVILRQPSLLTEPIPILAAVRAWGLAGYAVYAICLYLAILSTLTACMRGLKGISAIIAVVLISQLGFTGVVDAVYPVLGSCCFVMLLLAKFAKSRAASFHSKADVI